jgi:hypothetical protein
MYFKKGTTWACKLNMTGNFIKEVQHSLVVGETAQIKSGNVVVIKK